MKNVTRKEQTIFWIAPIIALLIGLLPMPYGYYTLSRLIVSGCALYFAIDLYKQNKTTHVWIFGFIAILYNPFFPITLGSKALWIMVNIPTVVYFYINRNN